MKRSVTVKEFAEEIGVSPKTAYGMACCEAFAKQKISFDIGIQRSGKKNKSWRIDLIRYYEARNARLI